jgi:alcohol dehydrogenase class IV
MLHSILIAVPRIKDSAENIYNPTLPRPIKALCYAALSDLFQYLPKCKADPGNLEMRQKLMVASWMSLWPMKVEKYR